MANKSPNRFINSLYWFFYIAYILQFVGFLLITTLNYVSFDSKGADFTIRGTIHAYETGNGNEFISADPTKKPANSFTNRYGVTTLDTVGSSTIYYINGLRSGFMRIDYYGSHNKFTFKNMGLFLCDVLIAMMWMLVTYQVAFILRSMRNESAFVRTNIIRITFIGILILLIPFIEATRDQLFYYILQQHLSIPGYRFYSIVNWKDFLPPPNLFSASALGGESHNRFPLIAVGLIILAIAQIFKSGIELQKEKDLTI